MVVSICRDVPDCVKPHQTRANVNNFVFLDHVAMALSSGGAAAIFV
jgi:hypothetical protein